MPSSSLPKHQLFFDGFDKVVHFGFYSIMSFLWIAGFKRQNNSTKIRDKAFLIGSLLSFSIGLFTEVAQELFTKNRYFELLDLIANGIGCIFGIIIFRLVYKNYYK